MDAPPNSVSVPDQALDVVRSEERSDVRVVRTAVETVRVSRRIVTETVQVPVTVRREELTVTRTPVTGSPATGAPRASGVAGQVEDLVLVLHEEVPVVSLQVRATERVTVGVDTVSTDEVVSADLRREQVEVETSVRTPTHT